MRRTRSPRRSTRWRISCPTDAVQSVTIHLRVAKPGTNANTMVENSLVVYRYAQSPGAATAPYQYSATVG